MDALPVKVKDQGRVSNKAIYLAIGVTLSGLKQVLGLWASENEEAKFWLGMITQFKTRDVKDIFLASVDGLKGCPEAIETTFPQTQVQLCLVHLMRHSLGSLSAKDRPEVALDWHLIYRAATSQEAEHQLAEFAQQCDAPYPVIASSFWRANRARVIADVRLAG